MCERFAVTGYPTLVLFDKGMMHTYRGAREQPDLVDFAVVRALLLGFGCAVLAVQYSLGVRVCFSGSLSLCGGC